MVEDLRFHQNRVRAELYNCGACVCKSNVEIRIAGSFCRPQICAVGMRNAILGNDLKSRLWPIKSQPCCGAWGPGFPGGSTPYNGLYREAPPERGTFFSLQVYKRVGISQVEVYKRVGKLVVSQRELNE